MAHLRGLAIHIVRRHIHDSLHHLQAQVGRAIHFQVVAELHEGFGFGFLFDLDDDDDAGGAADNTAQ